MNVVRVTCVLMQVELDRTLAAQERGYRTFLFKLLQPQLTAKNDLLVGAHVSSDMAPIFCKLWESCAAVAP